jgi:hypothetical protein
MQKASSNVLNAQNGSDPSRSTADLSPVHARAACTAHPRFSASSNGATKGAGSGTHAVEDIARIYHNLKEVTPNQKAANRAKESEAVSENSTLPPYLKDIGWSQLLERLGEGPMRPDDAGDHGVGNSAGHSKDFPLTSPHPISGGRVGSARCTQKRRATSAERKLKDSKINVSFQCRCVLLSLHCIESDIVSNCLQTELDIGTDHFQIKPPMSWLLALVVPYRRFGAVAVCECALREWRS